MPCGPFRLRFFSFTILALFSRHPLFCSHPSIHPDSALSRMPFVIRLRMPNAQRLGRGCVAHPLKCCATSSLSNEESAITLLAASGNNKRHITLGPVGMGEERPARSVMTIPPLLCCWRYLQSSTDAECSQIESRFYCISVEMLRNFTGLQWREGHYSPGRIEKQ